MRIIGVIAITVVVCTTSAAADDAPFLESSPFHEFAKSIPAHSSDPATGNHVVIVNDAHDALVLRAHLIRNARHTLDIQTFIWRSDESGRFFLNEVLEAAHRGVKVRLLIDYLGTDIAPDIVAHITAACPAFEIRFYRPAGLKLKTSKPELGVNAVIFHGGINQRMHNKIILVDDAVAITGGRNFDNHYFNQSVSYNFKDRDIMVMGPTLPEVRASFDAFWEYKLSVPAQELLDVQKLIRDNTYPPDNPFADDDFGGLFDSMDAEAADAAAIASRFIDTFAPARRLTVVADRPGKNKGFWLFRLWGGGQSTSILKETIKQAEESLVIQSPYLVVNRWARRVFKDIRKRAPDIDIRISTNSFAATDSVLAYSANYRLRSSYIDRLGFEIFEFEPHPEDLKQHLPNFEQLKQRAQSPPHGDRKSDPPFLSLHAKSFVMDDRVSYIGTYNLDPRSFNLNTEIGFLIEDEAIARALKQDILRDMAPGNSWVIAKIKAPLADVNGLFEGISSLSPIDIWPIRNTSSFELKPGYRPVPPDHKDFYNRYRDIGKFPGKPADDQSEILTSFYKTFGKIMTPAL